MRLTRNRPETRRFAALRAVLAAFAALALLGWLDAALAGPGDGTRPLCEVCRRFADSSPSRMEISFTYKKRNVVKRCCSVFCYLEMMEDYADKEPDYVRIINFATLDTELPLWVNLDKAWFMLTMDGDPDKCRDPYAFAFQTRKQAEDAADGKDGVLVMDSGELLGLVKELTDEFEPQNHDYPYAPNRHGKR